MSAQECAFFRAWDLWGKLFHVMLWPSGMTYAYRDGVDAPISGGILRGPW